METGGHSMGCFTSQYVVGYFSKYHCDRWAAVGWSCTKILDIFVKKQLLKRGVGISLLSVVDFFEYQWNL